MSSTTLLCLSAISAIVLNVARTEAQDAKYDRHSPDPQSAAELVGRGYRRVHRVERAHLSPDSANSFELERKQIETDPRTGELMCRTFTDFLPENWQVEAPKDGRRVDSFGDPIVNEPPGLPGWSARDVAALRDAVTEWAERARTAAAVDQAEVEFVLGNYLGQAITRGIDVGDLVRLADSTLVTPGVAASIVSSLRYHEDLRWKHHRDHGEEYLPGQFGPEVLALLEANGFSLLDDVLAIDGLDVEGGLRGGPSGCYTRSLQSAGIALLLGDTTIWNASNTDDAFADIAIGWDHHHHYTCTDHHANSRDTRANSMVRISTNGYLTFFQLGGSATVGNDFTNDPIPSALDPDGFIAGWWDDLIIAANQGSADRVSYKVDGAFGDRTFTVQWFSVSRLGGSTTDFHTFQIRLHENSDVVELNYPGLFSGWGSDTLDSATIGMEDADGFSGDCGPTCDGTNDSRPGNNFEFEPNRPGNDDCGDRAFIYTGGRTMGTLINASNDGAATCGGSSFNRDVWYLFTARCAGTLTVSTCGTRDAEGPGVGPDTVVAIHNLSCAGTTASQIACNDDAGAACTAEGGSSLDSSVSAALATDQTVLVRISHFGSQASRLGNGRFRAHFDLQPSAQRPSNDDCTAAETLPGTSGTVVGDLSCATFDKTGERGCSLENADTWYRYAATCDGVLRVDTCGSAGAGGAVIMLTAFSDCPGTSEHHLDCDIGGCGSDALLEVPMTSGQVILIRASVYINLVQAGGYRLNYGFIRTGPAPVNDACTVATPITGYSGSLMGSLECATPDGVDGCAFPGSPDVWYTYRAPCDGTLTVETCGTHDAPGIDLGMDTVLSFHTGCAGGPGSLISCNDDSDCPGEGHLYDSRLSIALQHSNVVAIRVSAFAGEIRDGQFRLNFRYVAPGRPVNDRCAAAIPIGEGSVTGTTFCGDATGRSTCGISNDSPDVFYVYTPVCSGGGAVSTCQAPTNYDSVLSIHAACPPSVANQIACNDDDICGVRARVGFPVTAGVPVIIRVAGFNGQYGTFRLNVSCCPCDWNGRDFLDSQDYFDFLDDFFNGDADFNGVDATDSQDFFEFLECFFAGCA